MSDFEKLRDAVISDVVLPTLIELDEETKQPIQATVSIQWRSAWEAQEEIRTRKDVQSESAAIGEVRVVLKEITPGNVNVSAESILKGLAPGSGFSGFSLRGKLELNAANKWVARITACTNRYNVWEWRKEFAH